MILRLITPLNRIQYRWIFRESKTFELVKSIIENRNIALLNIKHKKVKIRELVELRLSGINYRCIIIEKNILIYSKVI